MGMFDDIRCEYPLPDNASGEEKFQTKDFECRMQLYRITAEGRLLRETVEWPPNPDYEPGAKIGGKGWHPYLRRHVGWEDIEYHGWLNFYTHTGSGEWLEYDAKFTDGRLVSAEITAAPLVPAVGEADQRKEA